MYTDSTGTSPRKAISTTGRIFTNVGNYFFGLSTNFGKSAIALTDDLVITGLGTRTVIPNRLAYGYGAMSNTSSTLGSMFKTAGTVLKVAGYAMLAYEAGSAVYNNFNNANLSFDRKITDSIVDVGFIVGGATIGLKVGAAIGSFIPIPVLGTLIGAGIGVLIGSGIGYIYNKYGDEIKVAFNSAVMEIGTAISNGYNDLKNGWNSFWSFNWA